MQKLLHQVKKMQPNKVEYTWKWMHDEIGDKIWYQNATKA